MTTEELALILSARFDSLDKAFNEVDKRLDGYAKKTTEANAEAQASFVASTVAIGAAGYALVDFMKQAVLSAARSEELNIVLYNMGSAIGMTRLEIDRSVDSIAKLGISQNSAKESTLRFLQANLDVADAVKLARVAQDLAVISGQNSSDTFNSLTTAIVTQRTELLQQVGIMQGVDKIFSEYGKTLGVASKNLSETQKRQAILNTILQAGARASGNYVSAMDSGYKILGSMKRLLEDTSKTIGDTYLPAFNAVVAPIYHMMEAFNNSSPAVKTAVALALGAGTAYVALAASMRLLMVTLPGLTAAFSSFNTVLMANPIIAGTAALAFGVIAGMGVLEKSINDSERAARALNTALNETRRLRLSEVEQIDNPVERLRQVKLLLDARRIELEQGRGLTEQAKTTLRDEISRLYMLQNILGKHEKELELLNQKKIKTEQNKRTQEEFNKAVDKAYSGMRNEFAEFEYESKLKEESTRGQLENQIQALEQYRIRYKSNAVKLAAIDRELNNTRRQLAMVQVEEERRIRQQLYDATVGAFTSMVSQQVDVFNLGAFRMVEVWEGMINRMVQMFLESALLDIFAMLGLGGGGNLAGLFSGGKSLLGFDNPTNDAAARTSGSNKWFRDYAENFSKGYVQSALATGPDLMTSPASNSPVAASQASRGAGVTVNYRPVFAFETPSTKRLGDMALSTLHQRGGFR